MSSDNRFYREKDTDQKDTDPDVDLMQTMTITTKTMTAFHSDPVLKQAMLDEITWHREQDMIAQGVYGEDGRYCAVGCSIHSLNRRKGTHYDYSDHSVYETELGIPKALARLQDGLFEALPSSEALDFPYAFMQAITPGADLSVVVNRFLVWLLTDPDDGVIRFADGSQRIRDVITRVSDLHQGVVEGAAWAAGDAARAAGDAARAAGDAARAAGDAGDAATRKMVHKLLQLLTQAPLPETTNA